VLSLTRFFTILLTFFY
jgi:hypothetical protein